MQLKLNCFPCRGTYWRNFEGRLKTVARKNPWSWICAREGGNGIRYNVLLKVKKNSCNKERKRKREKRKDRKTHCKKGNMRNRKSNFAWNGQKRWGLMCKIAGNRGEKKKNGKGKENPKKTKKKQERSV